MYHIKKHAFYRYLRSDRYVKYIGAHAWGMIARFCKNSNVLFLLRQYRSPSAIFSTLWEVKIAAFFKSIFVI